MITQHPRAQGFLAKEPSRFVGRAAELEELGALSGQHSRLVTIAGPGGIGKTRLALRYASARRFDYQSAGGVWFVDLAGARDLDAMCAAVLGTLRISDQATTGGEDAITAVGRALAARRRALIVLDNLEQLLPEAAGAVLRWLDAAPEARFLLTSRQPLVAIGEEVLALSPLGVPPPGAGAGDAVELYVDRVRSARGRYSPDDQELRGVGDIVRHLLGVPLAIELAAARQGADALEHCGSSSVGTPHTPGPGIPAVGGRFAGDALEPRSGGSERPPPTLGRLRTPRQALDWAWARLTRSERALLSQCSVFRGGFTLQAAESVIDLGSVGTPHTPGSDSNGHGSPVAALLQSLHKKSLISIDTRHDQDPPRFGMCESIREHAAEMLGLAPDPTAVAWRHARFYLDLGASAGTPISGTPGTPMLRERENMAAVLELGARAGRSELVLRAAIALDGLSTGTGLSRSQLAELDRALSRCSGEGAALVGRALGVRAGALRALGRLAESERDALTALSLAEEDGDLAQSMSMHVAIGVARFQLGELPTALEEYERALELAREIGDRAAESSVLQQVGAVQQSLGRASVALSYYEASLTLAVEARDRPSEARASMGLGSYHLERGDLDRARVYYERGFFLARELEMQRSLRIVTGYLGILHFDEGLLSEAERHLESAAAASKAVGDIRVEGVFLGILGAVFASQDRMDEARKAFDAAESLLSSNQFFRRVVAIHRGHLDLAEARQARIDEDLLLADTKIRVAERRIESARAAVGQADLGIASGGTLPGLGGVVPHPGALVQSSDDARIAVRILERALATERIG